MIDHTTRFNAPAVVKSKERLKTIDEVMKYQIAIFGTTGVIRSEKRKDFINDWFHELGQQFNINLKATLRWFPW